MKTFQLTKVFERDTLTGGVNFTLSAEYRIGITIFFVCLLIIQTDNVFFEGQLNDFFLGFLIALMVIGFSIALIPFSIAKKFGSVTFFENSIELHHKPKSTTNTLKETVNLAEIDEIRLQVINGFELFSSFYVIQASVKTSGENKEFGFVLTSKKDKRAYLDILEEWYSNHYPVKEIAADGLRIFKLNRGLKYKDVQKIKADYGIEW